MSKYKYSPDPNCRWCKGTGKKWVRANNQYAPCICQFFERDQYEEMGKVIGEAAKKIRKEEEAT